MYVFGLLINWCIPQFNFQLYHLFISGIMSFYLPKKNISHVSVLLHKFCLNGNHLKFIIKQCLYNTQVMLQFYDSKVMLLNWHDKCHIFCFQALTYSKCKLPWAKYFEIFIFIYTILFTVVNNNFVNSSKNLVNIPFMVPEVWPVYFSWKRGHICLI